MAASLVKLAVTWRWANKKPRDEGDGPTRAGAGRAPHAVPLWDDLVNVAYHLANSHRTGFLPDSPVALCSRQTQDAIEIYAPV